jgi:hypothetical protein
VKTFDSDDNGNGSDKYLYFTNTNISMVLNFKANVDLKNGYMDLF